MIPDVTLMKNKIIILKIMECT